VGFILKECFVTAASSKDGLDFYVFTMKARGGFWQLQPSVIVRNMLTSHTHEMLADLLRVPPMEVPAWFVAGGCPKLLSECPIHFFNRDIVARIDGESTWGFLQFRDGIVEESRTGATFGGKPDLYICKALGIDYPDNYIQEYDDRLAREGIDFGELLQQILAFEESLGDNPYDGLPDHIVAKLERMRMVPGFEIFGS
jgi:hypothetical protein